MWTDIVHFAVQHGISTAILLASLNFVLGIASAVSNNTFKLDLIGQILHKIAPLLVAFVAVKLFASPNFAPPILAVIIAQFSADIAKNVHELVPSIPIPDSLFGDTTTTKTV